MLASERQSATLATRSLRAESPLRVSIVPESPRPTRDRVVRVRAVKPAARPPVVGFPFRVTKSETIDVRATDDDDARPRAACRAPGVQRRRRAPVTVTRVKFGRVVAASRERRFSSVVRRAGDEPPKPPLADPDASIEPCLVGWTDVDENGIDVYCCEQPGGAIQCKTVEANPEHEECELMEQVDGSLDISCDEDDDLAGGPAR